MGLDNGFRVTGVKPEDLPPGITYDEWLWKNRSELELFYMRKYWGLRVEILRVLHAEDDMEITVDAEDIPAILKRIRKYMHPKYWDDNADSIWEADEAFPNLVQGYINLSWLHDYMEKHPEVGCFFYDSY